MTAAGLTYLGIGRNNLLLLTERVKVGTMWRPQLRSSREQPAWEIKPG